MTASDHFRSRENAAFFIAEIGGNHEGSYDYALKLCDLAIESGADAIKFQLYRGDQLVSSVSNPDRNAHFKKFELTRDQHLAIAERVRAAGRHYMASVWDQEMLDWIDPYIAIHKVGSGDLTCYPMLKALAATGKPIIFSTGLASLAKSGARSTSSRPRTRAMARTKSLPSCNARRPIPRPTRRQICGSSPRFAIASICRSASPITPRDGGDRARLCSRCPHYREALHRYARG